MTIKSSELCRFANVIFEIDFDDVGLYLTAVRCINTSKHTSSAKAATVSTASLAYASTFESEKTASLALPTVKEQRLDIKIDKRGRVDGVDFSFSEFA